MSAPLVTSVKVASGVAESLSRRGELVLTLNVAIANAALEVPFVLLPVILGLVPLAPDIAHAVSKAMLPEVPDAFTWSISASNVALPAAIDDDQVIALFDPLVMPIAAKVNSLAAVVVELVATDKDMLLVVEIEFVPVTSNGLDVSIPLTSARLTI